MYDIQWACGRGIYVSGQLAFIDERDKIIVRSRVIIHEVQINSGLRLAFHVNIKVYQLTVALDLRRSAGEYRSIDQRILFLVGVIHQHLITLHVYEEAIIPEMQMIELKADFSGVAELILDRDIP